MENVDLIRADRNMFLKRFEQLALANNIEIATLSCMFSRTSSMTAGAELLAEGQRTVQLHVLLDGWGFCYRILPNGGRQITRVLLPGDVCDLDRLYLGWINYAVQTLTPCTVATLDCLAVRTLSMHYPGISAGLGCLGALENASLIEKTVVLGRHPAKNRLAHLFCELFVRLNVIGHVQDDSYILPLTQTEMSDIIGITPIHLNRILQDLRSQKVIKLDKRKLIIVDWKVLCNIADFHQEYLSYSPVNESESSVLPLKRPKKICSQVSLSPSLTAVPPPPTETSTLRAPP